MIFYKNLPQPLDPSRSNRVVVHVETTKVLIVLERSPDFPSTTPGYIIPGYVQLLQLANTELVTKQSGDALTSGRAQLIVCYRQFYNVAFLKSFSYRLKSLRSQIVSTYIER